YRLLPALQMLYSQLSNVTAMAHSLDEVYDEFASAEEGAAADGAAEELTPPPPPLRWSERIELENISFTYAGASRPALDGVSLTLPKGASVAVVGRTGCGKSTLIDLLLGLHR